MAKRRIVTIYHSWVAVNRLSHARYMTSLELLALALLSGFDFLIFGNNQPYTIVRVLVAPIFIGFLFLNKKLADKPEHHKFLLLIPTFIFQLMYFYFLFHITGEKQNIVFIANIMTTFFLTFTLHKFFVEQYSFNALSIIVLTLGLNFFGWKHDEALVLIVTHVLSSMVTFYFRREFVAGLDVKLTHLKTFLPDNVAKMIMFSNDWKDISKAFLAKERFTICLCADWRDFQSMCGQKESSEISDIIEKYYDIVIGHLEKHFPEGNYYVNWVADELFVIFYTDSDDISSKETLEKAVIGFGHKMTNTIFHEINGAIENWNLMYDIGISCGPGLLGLQGPTKLKKTTLTGEVAGRAKRYQEEAKRLRKEFNCATPILVLDLALQNTIQTAFPKMADSLQELKANTKDIQNQSILVQILNIPVKLKSA